MYQITPGQDLLCIGYTGLYGTRYILDRKLDKITSHFSRTYLTEETQHLDKLPRIDIRDHRISVENIPILTRTGVPVREDEPELVAMLNAGELSYGAISDLLPSFEKKYGVSKIREIREGGILSALWDFCAEEGRDPATGRILSPGPGCEYFLSRIPVLQFTVELCECLELMPFRIHAGGAYLAAASQGYRLCEELNRLGVSASVFGHFTAGRQRLRMDGAEPGFLTNEHRDEIDKI